MRKFALLGLTILIMIFMFGCFPSRYVQYIESCYYDSIKNITRFNRLPLGYVEIPGNWNKTSYNNVSKQQFFRNIDSVSLAVAFWPEDQYGFYKRGETDMTFLNDFYEWDSKYIAEQINGQRKIIEQDSTQQSYILWNVYNDSDVNGYFLYGLKRGRVYNLYITTKKWKEQQKINFLKQLFTNKK